MKRLFVAGVGILLLGCSGGKTIPMDRPFEYVYGISTSWVGALGKTRCTNYEFIVVPRGKTVVLKDTVWVDGHCLQPEIGPARGDTITLLAYGPVVEVNSEPVRGNPSPQEKKTCPPPVSLTAGQALLAFKTDQGTLGYVPVAMAEKNER